MSINSDYYYQCVPGTATSTYSRYRYCVMCSMLLHDITVQCMKFHQMKPDVIVVTISPGAKRLIINSHYHIIHNAHDSHGHDDRTINDSIDGDDSNNNNSDRIRIIPNKPTIRLLLDPSRSITKLPLLPPSRAHSNPIPGPRRRLSPPGRKRRPIQHHRRPARLQQPRSK